MLLRLLLEEIGSDNVFVDVLGKPDRIPARRYPQAMAVALSLRHGWNRDDFVLFSKRLGVKVTTKDLADTTAVTAPDPSAPSASAERRRKTARA
jgi:hypothetical protein